MKLKEINHFEASWDRFGASFWWFGRLAGSRGGALDGLWRLGAAWTRHGWSWWRLVGVFWSLLEWWRHVGLFVSLLDGGILERCIGVLGHFGGEGGGWAGGGASWGGLGGVGGLLGASRGRCGSAEDDLGQNC